MPTHDSPTNRWPDRPTLSAAFYKGHGLGNDYLVFENGEDWPATEKNVQTVCDRHRGVGSDGIVVLLPGNHLRMFNPDGGEFERSGNGLRILGSYLWRRSMHVESYDVRVGGDEVHLIIHGRDGPRYDVSAEMGRATAGGEAVALDPGLFEIDGTVRGPDGSVLSVVPVSVGNPHLVVVTDGSAATFSEERLADVGPFLVSHPALHHGANVQLVRVTAPDRCDALIWERGVGRTSTSGTSACAVAVALVSSGRLAPGVITVTMPGGSFTVGVTRDLDVVLRGPVEEIFEGRLSSELARALRGDPES